MSGQAEALLLQVPRVPVHAGGVLGRGLPARALDVARSVRHQPNGAITAYCLTWQPTVIQRATSAASGRCRTPGPSTGASSSTSRGYRGSVSKLGQLSRKIDKLLVTPVIQMPDQIADPLPNPPFPLFGGAIARVPQSGARMAFRPSVRPDRRAPDRCNAASGPGPAVVALHPRGSYGSASGRSAWRGRRNDRRRDLHRAARGGPRRPTDSTFPEVGADYRHSRRWNFQLKDIIRSSKGEHQPLRPDRITVVRPHSRPNHSPIVREPFRRARRLVGGVGVISTAWRTGTAAGTGVRALPRLVGMVLANPAGVIAGEAFHRDGHLSR